MSKYQNRHSRTYQSQVKTNKTPWEKYGKFVLIGIIAILGVVGFRQYSDYKTEKSASEASRVYDSVIMAIRKKEYTKANELGTGLIKTYRNTPYAALTALLLARGTFDQGNLEATEKNLRQALEVAEPGPLQHIATVRLARILASQNKSEEALKLLTDTKTPDNYKALYEEAKGDIYVKLNDLEKARNAYALAVKSVPEGVPFPWLQLKQSDLSNESAEKLSVNDKTLSAEMPVNSTTNSSTNNSDNANNADKSAKSDDSNKSDKSADKADKSDKADKAADKANNADKSDNADDSDNSDNSSKDKSDNTDDSDDSDLEPGSETNE